MPLLNEANKIYVGSALATKVYLGTTLVWPSTGTRRQAMVGGQPPVFVNTDGPRDAMVPGAMINRNDA